MRIAGQVICEGLNAGFPLRHFQPVFVDGVPRWYFNQMLFFVKLGRLARYNQNLVLDEKRGALLGKESMPADYP